MMLVYLITIVGVAIAGRNFKPKFNKGHTVLSKIIRENTSPGLIIEDISKYVSDEENDKMIYDIDEDGFEICKIGRTDGILSLKISPDREVKATYQFEVSISDDYNGGVNRSISMKIYLIISDINDNKPVFDKNHYQVEVLEDVKVGEQILSIHADDIDNGVNGEINYEFADGGHEKFDLDPFTGVITVKHELDYEMETNYNFDVIAKDGGVPSLASKTMVIIEVKDIGDNKPYFSFNFSEREVKENMCIGCTIATMHAKDGDVSVNNKIRYLIVSGNEYGLFGLNQDTGNLTVARLLDREEHEGFKLKIKAYEEEDPDSFVTGNLDIRLLDVNDNKPKFMRDSYLVTIDDDRMFPETILTRKVKAVDKDATWRNNRIEYLMDPNEYFEVFPSSGAIILKKPLSTRVGEVSHFLLYATEKDTLERYTAKTNITVLVVKRPRVHHGKQSNGSIKAAGVSLSYLLLCCLLIHIAVNS